MEEWHAVLPKAEIIPISALHKFNVDVVLKRIQELLPESPAYFDKDQWTDKPARFFVTEIIREKILLYYDKEIPYSVEVVVEQFKETDKNIHINAVIYVERDSQKGIIIGHQGVALKRVSSEARKSLEKFFGKSIYLEVNSSDYTFEPEPGQEGFLLLTNDQIINCDAHYVQSFLRH